MARKKDKAEWVVQWKGTDCIRWSKLWWFKPSTLHTSSKRVVEYFTHSPWQVKYIENYRIYNRRTREAIPCVLLV